MYCLDLISEQERKEVNSLRKEYPEIEKEIDSICQSLEKKAALQAVQPPVKLKQNLMLRIYDLESGEGKKYPPLIRENSSAKQFSDWLQHNEVTYPDKSSYENISMHELPSIEQVTNFMVWVKQGHDEEEHNDFKEYIVILEGSCDMYFNDEKKHYNAGDIIVIDKNIRHHAVITSKEPMIAIVQRVAA